MFIITCISSTDPLSVIDRLWFGRLLRNTDGRAVCLSFSFSSLSRSPFSVVLFALWRSSSADSLVLGRERSENESSECEELW